MKITLLFQNGNTSSVFHFKEETLSIYKNGIFLEQCTKYTFMDRYETCGLYRHLYHMNYKKHEIRRMLDLPYWAKESEILSINAKVFRKKIMHALKGRNEEINRILNLT